MKVTLDLHLEVVESDGEPEWVWWAESPELPRFTTASTSLRETRSQAETAAYDILGTVNLEFTYRLVPVEFPSQADYWSDDFSGDSAQPEQRAESVTRAAPQRDTAGV